MKTPVDAPAGEQELGRALGLLAPTGNDEQFPAAVLDLTLIATETQAVPFGGLLHANDFRVATVQKNGMAIVDGHPRIFDVWDACADVRWTRSASPVIKLSWSDDLGETWTAPAVVSRGGDNYIPSVAACTRTSATKASAASAR